MGGGILAPNTNTFLKSAQNSPFFDTLYDLFQEKNLHIWEGLFFTFFDTKTKKRLKYHIIKKKKNVFSKIVLDIFCRLKTTWSIVNLKKSLDLVIGWWPFFLGYFIMSQVLSNQDSDVLTIILSCLKGMLCEILSPLYVAHFYWFRAMVVRSFWFFKGRLSTILTFTLRNCFTDALTCIS